MKEAGLKKQKTIVLDYKNMRVLNGLFAVVSKQSRDKPETLRAVFD